ncbi:hypothetical protein LSAT2_011700 [Lamellibrachia satsuma]|nr:hypothetical protein LSAT2_011700 [Lamellibrachia satsuma]
MGEKETRGGGGREEASDGKEASREGDRACVCAAVARNNYDGPRVNNITKGHFNRIAVAYPHFVCLHSRPFNCLPRVRHQSVRVSRRHETSRLHDLLTSGLLSTSRQQPRHHCGRTYSAGGEIMRPTATSVIVLFNPAE